MREVQVKAWCDYCWSEGEQKVESTRTFAVGAIEGTTRGPMARMLETCEEHSVVVLALIELTSRLPMFVAEKPGKKPLQAKPPTSTAAAGGVLFENPPALGQVGPPSSWPMDCPVDGCARRMSRNALVTHVWSQHADSPKPDAPTTCPDCGERAESAQSLAQHRRNQHGYDALEEALRHVPSHLRRAG